MSAAATFAFAAGLLATVNPCGFVMLPSFLSLYLGSPDDGERSLGARAAQGLCVGLALTAGFAGVFVIGGLILSIGLQSFIHVVPWLAAAIAASLVLAGLAMLAGRHVGIASASRVRVDGSAGGGYGRVALFGAGYAVASLACTVTIFLALIAQAVAQSNPLRLLVVLTSYVAGSATLLVALSLSVALARAGLARAVRFAAPAVGRLAGLLLVASGAYLIVYWLPTLAGSQSTQTPGVVAWIEQLSATLEGFLSVHLALFVGLLAALVTLGTLLLVVRLSGGMRQREPAEEPGVPAPAAQHPFAAPEGLSQGRSEPAQAEPTRARPLSATTL